jgi:hypothetical protein
MPRIRTIKPEFPHSESMGRVSRDARLTFILLWTIADDSGRLRGNSRMLASLLYPYDSDAPSLVDAWLAELEREDCVLRYKVNGDHYMEICNWLTHQKIDRPSKSKITPFANTREGSRKTRVGSKDLRTKDLRTKDQGEDQVSEEAPRRFAKPSVSEVAAYCQERKNTVDAEAFVAHYESNGWLVGKNRMKSWKHAVVTWEKNKSRFAGQSEDVPPTARALTPEEFATWTPVDGGGA